MKFKNNILTIGHCVDRSHSSVFCLHFLYDQKTFVTSLERRAARVYVFPSVMNTLTFTNIGTHFDTSEGANAKTFSRQLGRVHCTYILI